VHSNYLILLIILSTVLFVVGASTFTEEYNMFAGSRPKDLGVHAGKLKSCPNKPNCVSTQVEMSDIHYIAPISFSATAADAIARIKTIIATMPRTQVVGEAPNYIYAEFKTKLMGFVDDVEFFADENARLIHVRSASRLGYRDFNVNRERIEAIRQQFSAK
jgi:uncharacterized protein (DUF1499 family)